MPKMKTNSGAKKRFKVSGNGKVKHRPAGSGHLMTGKSAKSRRQKRQWKSFDGSHDAKDVRRMVGK